MFFLFAIVVQAVETMSFRIGMRSIQFRNLPEQRILISQDCFKSGKLSCLAYSAVSKVSLKRFEGESYGGMNPGSIACSKSASGSVVIGIDSQRNERSFCEFKDGSLIDTGTLNYYARKNDSDR
ncbi:MAG TPA: hypothetical protein DCS07_06370 [Bdellovibrionales bacterium]|nr:MAG: hypothetical protein A2Z97_12315 [Bdellovibrionales bacterium GWB1_52_6]OFZ03726.1 MAG: hypothetical protein A2X97_14295 [Bdellovibrionales bacterium GWA1_52_35]HAR42241.1 hypothetical protein [Bdellovibrionales bacterium]HCM38763.1 hypothetical protein [Bdellovibrionales bacterium]